jgi:hypothetical protein
MRQTETRLDLIGQQVVELRKFSKVANVLRGVCGLVWLPGLTQRFDGGPRAIKAPPKGQKIYRPIAVTLEVTPDLGLTLGGAISLPRDGKLVYNTIFKYEFTLPMAPDATGSALSSENGVLARRALGMLRAFQPRSAVLEAPKHPQYLVPFTVGGEQYDANKLKKLSGGMHPGLVEAYRERLRHDMTDSKTIPGLSLVNAAVVPNVTVVDSVARRDGYEDFSPVLGVPHWNPEQGLHEMPNPAKSILRKHGSPELETIDATTLSAIVREFRDTLPLGERLLDDEVYDALFNPAEPVRCAAGPEGFDDAKVLRAMRQICGNNQAVWEATDADLLRAARNPSGPLFLTRLSVTQLVDADALHKLPVPYAGDFLPPLNWQPPRKPAVKAA